MHIQRTLVSAWPLFFGLAMMMIGNGLQGTLLGVRASMEGFGVFTIGLVMSLYYAGFLIGSLTVPRLLHNVGHIRVFAALASLASATVLLHGLFVDPISWSIVRIITGFAYAGLFIIVESWLNDMATKETRGKLMAVYLLTTYLGMVVGQFLLNFGSPETIELFVLTSIFVSLALLPISLSKRPAPDFMTPARMSPRDLWKVSPLGMYAVTLSGLGNSILFAIGAVYAAERGMSVQEIATFMAAVIFGGVAFQLPIGYLSDRIERRKVIIMVATSAAIFAMIGFFVADIVWALYIAGFALGGMSATIYGLCVAYANDYLDPSQYVAASSSLILVNGMGAVFGPLLATGLMTSFGSGAFFPAIGGVYFSITLFALYRAFKRPALPLEEQVQYLGLSPRSTVVAAQLAEEEYIDDPTADDEEGKADL